MAFLKVNFSFKIKTEKIIIKIGFVELIKEAVAALENFVPKNWAAIEIKYPTIPMNKI